MASQDWRREVIGPSSAMLGRRLHLQHGPIDLVIEAWGDETEIRAAYQQATEAFEPVLQTLADELPILRQQTRTTVLSSPRKPGSISGPVAKRMVAATQPYDTFITPMAAVAGSVADHILAAMSTGRTLTKASVNNGGDIALFLASGESVTVGVGDMHENGVTLRSMKVTTSGGIATSGWRGRSHSLGIADYVTVVARNAATADAAATLIANAIDLPDSDAVTRSPAEQLSPDSDLETRLVTVDVGALSEGDVSTALSCGAKIAQTMIERGIIVSAILGLRGESIAIGGGPTPSALSNTLQKIGEPA